MITTTQFVSDLVDNLVAQGVTLADDVQLKADLEDRVNEWLDHPDAVPASLSQKLAYTVGLFQSDILGRYDFWTLTPTGGVYGDGTFDVQLPDGTTVQFPSLSVLTQSVQKGDPGGVAFTFKTATADADPGAGCLRLNNATPASVTFLYFDNTDLGGTSVTAWLDSFDDNGSSNRGQIYLHQAASDTFMVFRVAGAVVDGTGYRKVPVVHLAGPTLFTANARVVALFAPVGTGDVVGPAGATDGHAVLFDGATGKLLKSAGFAPENAALKGVANGYAGLDSGGKVPTGQLPASVLGGLNYQGTWNATTNSPAIPAASSGNKGWFYKVATAGTTAIDGVAEWQVGDWIVSNGATWDKVDNTDQVVSVAGLQGSISLASLKTVLGITNVDDTADLDKPISNATQAALDALAVDYINAVALTLELTELEVTDAARVITEDDDRKLLFFTAETDKVFAYVDDSLPIGFTCGVLMASDAVVEVTSGISTVVQAPGGLTMVTTRWKFGVLRRLTASLAVLHGADEAPADGLNRTIFEYPRATALLNPMVI